MRAYLAERADAGRRTSRKPRSSTRKSCRLQPENVMILNNLAWAAMETKDPGALGYAEKAYSLAPQNASVLDTYGWLLLQKGDVKRSVELLTAAVNRAPKDPDMRLHLAKALIAAPTRRLRARKSRPCLRWRRGWNNGPRRKNFLKDFDRGRQPTKRLAIFATPRTRCRRIRWRQQQRWPMLLIWATASPRGTSWRATTTCFLENAVIFTSIAACGAPGPTPVHDIPRVRRLSRQADE